MKRYEKRMAALVLILLVSLAVKSLIVDPVRTESMELDLYQQYAQLAAPFQGRGNPPPKWLYTYRTVSAEKVSSEGETRIMYQDNETNKMMEILLPGQYRAQVRAYIFYILPAKNIRVEGGLIDGGSETQS